MGIQRNRPLTSPEPRASGFGSWLSSLFSSTPATTSTSGSLQGLLDRLTLQRPTPAPSVSDPAARQALSRLLQPGQAARLMPAEWQSLAAQWSRMSAASRAQLTTQLSAAGVKVAPSPDGKYVTFSSGDLRVIAEPATQRLRRSQAGTVLCYEGTQMVKAMKTTGTQVQVTTASGTEVWDATTGQGTVNGLPIVGRPAPVDPNEPPRDAWDSPLSNDLQEPAWTDTTDMDDYAPAYDAAVRATGGRVLEPSDPDESAQELYNCHSFATTRGQGDLFDPFMRETHPHWINNPMNQLMTGPFQQVQEFQRVHPGDVVVYFKDGKPTHTGVVRQVDAAGNPTLIESKFGILGRYLHEPFDVPGEYGYPEQFFRPEA